MHNFSVSDTSKHAEIQKSDENENSKNLCVPEQQRMSTDVSNNKNKELNEEVRSNSKRHTSSNSQGIFEGNISDVTCDVLSDVSVASVCDSGYQERKSDVYEG